jgi:hypothetical protein
MVELHITLTSWVFAGKTQRNEHPCDQTPGTAGSLLESNPGKKVKWEPGYRRQF